MGAALARALGAAGSPAQSCGLFSRTGVPRSDVPPSVRTYPLDITGPGPLSRALENYGTLVIAVAPGPAQDRHAVYVGGTRALLTNCTPWRRVIYVSSTSAFAEVDGWVDETTPEVAVSGRGQVQRDAEAVVHQICGDTETPHLMLRLAGLYGPGRPLGRIYGGRSEAPLRGNGNTPTNLVHLEDAVQAVVAGVAHPRMSGLISVCDDDHRPRRQMYAAIAASRGVPAPAWELPEERTPPRGRRVSNQKMKSALGVRLLHPEHSGS